jgi:flagellar hook-associated protein FlgK
MKEELQIEPEDYAARLLDLFEQIGELNKLIAIHHEHQANPVYAQQYIDRREEYLEELNQILETFELKVAPLTAA